MLIAYVELKPGSEASAEELAAHARAHIQERAAVPIDIVALAALPMTTIGKVSKPHSRVMAL